MYASTYAAFALFGDTRLFIVKPQISTAMLTIGSHAIYVSHFGAPKLCNLPDEITQKAMIAATLKKLSSGSESEP
jgi:hypothetical protein